MKTPWKNEKPKWEREEPEGALKWKPKNGREEQAPWEWKKTVHEDLEENDVKKENEKVMEEWNRELKRI